MFSSFVSDLFCFLECFLWVFCIHLFLIPLLSFHLEVSKVSRVKVLATLYVCAGNCGENWHASICSCVSFFCKLCVRVYNGFSCTLTHPKATVDCLIPFPRSISFCVYLFRCYKNFCSSTLSWHQIN